MEIRNRICCVCGIEIEEGYSGLNIELCDKCGKEFLEIWKKIRPISNSEETRAAWDYIAKRDRMQEEEIKEYIENDQLIGKEELRSRNKYYETVYCYSNSKLKVKEGDKNRESLDRMEDEIENMGHTIYELISTFKNLGLDFSDLDNPDVATLLLFLYKFKLDKNMKYAEFFGKYNYENLEYLSEDNLTRNGQITMQIAAYLRRHCGRKFLYEVDLSLYTTKRTRDTLLKKLQTELERVYIVNEKFADINTALNTMRKSKEDIECCETLNIYEAFYLWLIIYCEKIISVENQRVYGYMSDYVKFVKVNKQIPRVFFDEKGMVKEIDEMEILRFSRKSAEDFKEKSGIMDVGDKKYYNLWNTMVTSDFQEYVEINASRFQKLVGINRRKLKGIISKLKQYEELLYNYDKRNELVLLAMIEECCVNFKKDEGKEVSKNNKFYRSTVKDRQLTFGAALLKGKEAPLLLRKIMSLRLEALTYAYLGLSSKYSLYIKIMLYIYMSSMRFASTVDLSYYLQLCEELRRQYENAIKIIDRKDLGEIEMKY